MALSHNPRIITNGLVLCLDAANPKSYPGSGTTWKDLSGNGNDGTLVNGVGYDSANNGSLTFDGVDDYFQTQLNLGNSNQSFSFGGFVKILNPGSSNEFIFSNYVDSGHDGFFAISASGDSGSGGFWLRDNTKSSSVTISGPGLNNDQWYFLFAVRNAQENSMAMYVDSNLYQNKNFDGSLQVKDADSFLGGVAHVNDTDLSCEISNTFVYNRALSEAEIKQNYNALRGRYGI